MYVVHSVRCFEILFRKYACEEFSYILSVAMRSGATAKLCLAEIHKLLICENLNLNYRSDYFYIVLACLNTRYAHTQTHKAYRDDHSKAHICVVPVSANGAKMCVPFTTAPNGSNII